MKRRSKVSGGRAKRRVDAPKLKRDTSQREASHPTSVSAEEEGEIARLSRELREALERQTATSKVLNVISHSPGELDPVFNAILQNAARICEAQFGTLNLYDGSAYRAVALHNAPQNFARTRLGKTFRPHPKSGLAEVVLNKQVVHIDDVRTRRPYIEGDKTVVELADIAGARTILIVPMLNKETLVGTISIYRQEVRPFTGKQIELVKNFAAQAVIAIGNARLLNELRESLEQQTATSEVLQVISNSPAELEPVFASVLANATRLCEAAFANLLLREDDTHFRVVAMHNPPSALADIYRRQPVLELGPEVPLLRAAAAKAALQIADFRKEAIYESGHRAALALGDLGGARTFLIVPLLKEDELIGGIAIYRQEVRSFSDKQVALVTNFAAQAVIAIENARLLNELRQRTTDLAEALEQQTATSEILQTISGSPGDLEPVFAAILEKAARICDAHFGNIFRWDGDALWLIASQNTPTAFIEHRKRVPFRPNQGNPIGDMLRTNTAIHVADLAQDERYIEKRDLEVVAAVELGGIRTFVAVPMLKDENLIGAIILYRQEVRPFTGKQIELLKHFANQAVIAIENARLLNELRASLQQQTATAKVLQVISSVSFDLQSVLDNLTEAAGRLCEADASAIWRPNGSVLELASFHGEISAEWLEYAKRNPIAINRTTISGRTILEGKTIHFPDVLLDAEMKTAYQTLGRHRAALGVPLSNKGEIIGAFALVRYEVRPFTDRQIELVTTFADQATIALENTRLLRELRERTEQVESFNRQLEQRVTDQVSEIERMSRLRRFLPPQVADLIVASGSEEQLESHRREITALFCDLRGFTGFTESADAEDVIALLREYHAAIGEKIVKYSGTLERYAGDGVMVIFNDPVPVENPALQAVLMALEVRQAIGSLTEAWRRLGHDIGFGIGIAHGFATLGTIGFEGRFDYAAIGTVSNVASRLCDEAKPGQILISPRVLVKVENAVIVEPAGEFELKGIRRPLAAYNVLGAALS